MPLFELFRTTKSKPDSTPEKPISSPADPSSVPENEFVELVWENGQILAQAQSQPGRTRRSALNSNLFSPGGNWLEPETRQKSGKSKNLDFGSGDFAAASREICLGQDDDAVPWLSYPFNGSLHNDDFCSDFLPELSGITGGGDPETSDSTRLFDSEDGEVTVARAGPTPTQLSPPSSSPQQLRLPFSSFKSRFLGNAGKATATATDCEDSGKTDRSSAFSSFPCFPRQATLLGSDRITSKASVVNKSGSVDLNFTNSSGVKRPGNRHGIEAFPIEDLAASRDRDEAKNGNFLELDQTGCGASETGGTIADGEKNVDHAAGSSSVCSGNSAERDSCDPQHKSTKRKSRDTDESNPPSEDVDEEPVREKEQVPSRGTTSKRRRAAEVHNLSERRRRDRINEKMRALQELIPNCNKADKASMLDEAIEYLKTLQLQVQMMTMGAGLYMPPLMLPSGMQNMHPPHLMPFPHMGLGIRPGIGYGGMGVNAGSAAPRPVIQIPSSVHFPTMHHGMVPGAFGYPGQGIPVSMPRTPLLPYLGPSVAVTSATGHSGYGEAAAMASSSKETSQRMGDKAPTNADPGCQVNRPPSQGLVQGSSQTSEANAMESGGQSKGSHGSPIDRQ